MFWLCDIEPPPNVRYSSANVSSETDRNHTKIINARLDTAMKDWLRRFEWCKKIPTAEQDRAYWVQFEGNDVSHPADYIMCNTTNVEFAAPNYISR